MPTIFEAKQLLSSLLPHSSDSEAEQILFHVLRVKFPIKKISDIYSHTLDEAQWTEAYALARHRAAGVPLQHLLGYQFFLNHEYRVSPDVLIPRPETEVLLQTIFQESKDSPLKFAELGLGSGIITCELLFHFPKLTGVASELSAEAQKIAEQNFGTVIGSDWSSRLQIIRPKKPTDGFEILTSHGPFDLVVSNPPYVAGQDEIQEQVLKHEPHLALFPPSSPNFFYENFVQHADVLLKSGGRAFFEVPHERAEEIIALFDKNPRLKSKLVPDLTGRPRVLVSQLIL